MSEYMREASAALRAWVDSFDAAGTGIPMVDLVLRHRYDEQEPLTVQLAELTSDDFRYLLEHDAAARAGTGPVEHHGHSVEPGDALRYAAARLEMLTNSRAMSYKVDLRRPGNAASVLEEASRACNALAGMVEHATEGVLGDLRGGALVALAHADGPHIVPDQAETAEDYGMAAGAMVDLLREATAELAKLSGAIGQLQPTITAIGATPADGSTLATEAVLEHKTVGAANLGRYHVRVYRPEGAKPVVLIGDMDDNHSASITNCVEHVAAAIAEELLDGAAWDSVTWIQFYAPGRFAAPTTGLIQLVEFSGPFEGPVWRGIGHDRLEELAGGPVKSWHTKDHNVSTLTEQGAVVIRSRSRPRVPSTTGNTRPPVGAHLDDSDVDEARPRRRWWQRRE